MKTVKYFIVAIILIIVLMAGLTSCATAKEINQDTDSVAGYTLKNKAELLQQKILNTKNSTVVVKP